MKQNRALPEWCIILQELIEGTEEGEKGIEEKEEQGQ